LELLTLKKMRNLRGAIGARGLRFLCDAVR
jgi:hypothetical protein